MYMTIIFKQPLGRSKPNFMWSLHGNREHEFCKNGYVHMTKMTATPYIVKTFKIFFSRTGSSMILKLGKLHWRLKLYKVCINGDSGLTMTYFTARSNMVDCAKCFKVMNWDKLQANDQINRKITFLKRI